MVVVEVEVVVEDTVVEIEVVSVDTVVGGSVVVTVVEDLVAI
ncbi:hypothetical protein YN1HA_21740 [Sulfurisphaera ohwakuensis]